MALIFDCGGSSSAAAQDKLPELVPLPQTDATGIPPASIPPLPIALSGHPPALSAMTFGRTPDLVEWLMASDGVEPDVEPVNIDSLNVDLSVDLPQPMMLGGSEQDDGSQSSAFHLDPPSSVADEAAISTSATTCTATVVAEDEIEMDVSVPNTNSAAQSESPSVSNYTQNLSVANATSSDDDAPQDGRLSSAPWPQIKDECSQGGPASTVKEEADDGSSPLPVGSPPSGGESDANAMASRPITELSAADATKMVADRIRAIRKLNSGAECDEEDVKFPCPYPECNKTFGRPSHLKKHLYIHTGERNYKCDVCNAAFKTQWTLTKHVRIHTGEKPFSCDQCDMHFTQRGSWRRHIFSHHRKSVSKSLQCQMHRCPKCCKCYKELINLNKHLQLAHNITSSTQLKGRGSKKELDHSISRVDRRTHAVATAKKSVSGRRRITPYVQACAVLDGCPGSLYGTRKTLS